MDTTTKDALLDSGEALIGDLVQLSAAGKTELGMFAMDEYRMDQSVRWIAGLAPGMVYPGHGDPFSGDAVREKFGS